MSAEFEIDFEKAIEKGILTETLKKKIESGKLTESEIKELLEKKAAKIPLKINISLQNNGDQEHKVILLR
jgi:hypothetical protein